MPLIPQKFFTLQRLDVEPLPLVALQNTIYSLLNKSNKATKADGKVFSAATTSSLLFMMHSMRHTTKSNFPQ